ncbi:MAG: hypothetical protein GYB64_02915, partial [Chloroflexi bacterium]|nr:hypothetical protein [Chloroflexota bacterium]
PYPAESSKHTPFEWGVKAAASIAEYAVRLGYPLSIAADETALPAPRGPLTWEAVLQYLARVEPQGRTPLGDVLAAHPVGRFAAVILPWPDPAAGQTLLGLRARGIAVLAVLLDPATFPAGGPSAGALAASLRANHMDVTLLSFGVDWAAALAEEIPA